MSTDIASHDDRTPLPNGYKLSGSEEFTHYIIERTLSRGGGFGITYLATEHFLENTRKVVIKENYPVHSARRDSESKVLIPHDGVAEFFKSARKKFLREAAVLRKLAHDNIVKVETVFEALGTAYYVMPYLDGACELHKVLAEPSVITEESSLPVLRSLLSALDYLHKNKLLHRDLKSNNIMLRADGTPVIIDFGLARVKSAGPTTSLNFGTPGFSPPEQGATNAGNSADLYSLGATCYHILTGNVPPDAQNRLSDCDPYEPLAHRAGLSSRFSYRFLSTIDKALAIRVKDRWQSAEEWLNALSLPSGGCTTHVNPASPQFDRAAARAQLREFDITENEYAEQLSVAIDANNHDLLSLLIAAGAEVNRQNNIGETPLYRAASLGYTACVHELLAAPGIDVSAYSPIVLAIMANDYSSLKRLLAKPGIPINKADKKGRTPLFWAAMAGHVKCLRALLAVQGIDVNRADNCEWTPLFVAARSGRTDCVRELLRVPGIEVNRQTDYGWTPLNGAAEMGHADCVKRLLAVKDIDVNLSNETGWTPLYWAAHEGHAKCVKLLLNARGIDINQADNNGKKPLSVDKTGLIQKRLDSRARKEKFIARLRACFILALILVVGWCVLVYSKIAYRIARENDFPLLMECYLSMPFVDVNGVHDFGETPLHEAVREENYGCLELLLRTPGIDVNCVDSFGGTTPLHTAVIRNDPKCVKALLAHPSINVNKLDHLGHTPLYWARRKNYSECEELLRNKSGAYER